MVEGVEINTAELQEIKEWNINDFISFSLLQTLKSATEDIIKYSVCVSNIEALMCDELEKDAEYNKAVQEKEEALESLGSKFEGIAFRELARFKFRLLIKRLKAKIPTERSGVL